MKRVFSVFTTFLAFSMIISTAIAQQEGSLSAYWSFDEGAGDTVIDQSENGNDGKINGQADWIDGVFGKALEFQPGSNVEIPDSDSLRDLEEYTVALWIKFNKLSADWNHIFEKDGSYGITVNSGGGDFRFTPNSGKVWVETKFKVEEGKWYHIAMTANNSSVSFYVDGKKQADTNEPLVFTNNIINIGHGPSYPVDGAVDEVKFWSKTLTLDEVGIALKGSAAVQPSREKLAIKWAYMKLY